MSNTTETVSEIENLYAMSDEELMNSAEPKPMQENQEQTTDVDNVEVEAEVEVEVAIEDTNVDTDTDNIEVDSANTENVEEAIDYQAFYEAMTKPFKANGREVQISNADDAIRLMQQGANYSKKMEELKPKRALLKVLEEQGLTDKDKLGYLVDLANKDPKAIAKLIKESEIDLYEFDTEQADDYSPNLNIVEPSAFEDTLNEVTSEYPEMLDVIPHMGQWDDKSKDALFNEPDILRVIAEHKRNGFYDKVVDGIENERMFGRLNNVSYLQAYAEVEAKLLANQNQGSNNSNSFTGTRPTNTTQSDTNKKKRASLPNATNTQNINDINMLAISDEELLKLNF